MPNQMRRARGFTLLELMVSIAIVAILSAIAIPNFMKFQARSKQAEAISNLKALYIAEQAYYQANSTYTQFMASLGFNPDRGNRYQYNLNGTLGNTDARTGTTPSTPLTADAISIDTFQFPNAYVDAPIAAFKCAVSPFVVTGATGSFLAGAQGNDDNDATTDQWTISSFSRVTTGCDANAHVSAGVPANEQDDVAEP